MERGAWPWESVLGGIPNAQGSLDKEGIELRGRQRWERRKEPRAAGEPVGRGACYQRTIHLP